MTPSTEEVKVRRLKHPRRHRSNERHTIMPKGIDIIGNQENIPNMFDLILDYPS